MSLQSSKTRLVTATKKLSVSWHHTQDYWRDDKSRQFEEKYLEELLLGVSSALEAIGKLEKLLTVVKHDCE